MTKYKRALLKLSGECLKPEGKSSGVDFKSAHWLAQEIALASKSGVELAVVIGGGNIIRGAKLAEEQKVDQTTTDAMGMLATGINVLALKAALENIGCQTIAMCAFPVGSYLEAYSGSKAKRYLSEKKIVLLAGGTGWPYFSTDSGAALRSLEINSDALLKGTKVDGVYDADPQKDKKAKRFESLTYDEIIEKKLGVMDLTAVTMCREHKLPLVVFDTFKDGNLARVVKGEEIGTVVYG